MFRTGRNKNAEDYVNGIAPVELFFPHIPAVSKHRISKSFDLRTLVIIYTLMCVNHHRCIFMSSIPSALYVVGYHP